MKRSITLRRSLRHVVFALVGFTSAVAKPVLAQQRELLRYEPPAVDYVYPLEEGEADAPSSADTAPASPPPPPPMATAAPVAEGTGSPAPAPPAALSPPVVAVPAAEPATEYGAKARVKVPPAAVPHGTHKISMASARDLPGAFGDPLRVLESLPGVVPLTSGLPYVYIRGAPPAAQGFIYDDIPLPQLFHAAFGPAMIHPRATGDVRLDAGVPEARYGRRLGGVLLAEGMPLTHDFGAELEVRAIDLGGWVQTPVGKGEVAISGRIGYPVLALRVAQAMGLVDKDTSANYGNGQLRFRYPLNTRDRFELVWLGAFDKINLPGLSNDPRAGASQTHFERIETRLVRDIPRGEVGAAFRFGFDGSELGSALSVRSFTFGPRLWSQIKVKRHTLRIGADLIGSTGQVVNGQGAIASPDGDLRINLPQIAQAAGRNQGGVYAQGGFQLGDKTLLQIGARLDYWGVSSKVEIAVDPRIRLTYDIMPKLSVHGAFGTTHQPAVFLLPTAGLTDVALDRGLMRSFQSELGAEYKLTKSTSLEVQGYLHHYDNLLLPELVTDGVVPDDPPLVSSNAYGVETFLMRDLSEQVSGWISYTLGFADADSGKSVVGKFKPDYDVRHVINTVVAWRVWRGLKLSGRFQARSGRVVEQPNPRYTQRLPWFRRADVRIGYAWRGRFADMTAYVEWLNLFVQREYTDVDCLLGHCTAKQAPVIAIPNIGVRAEF